MNARSTAALLDNPGCVRRAVLDTARVDTARLAARPRPTSALSDSRRSRSAKATGSSSESRLNGYAELVRVLAELGVELPARAVGTAKVKGLRQRGPCRQALARMSSSRHCVTGEPEAAERDRPRDDQADSRRPPRLPRTRRHGLPPRRADFTSARSRASHWSTAPPSPTRWERRPARAPSTWPPSTTPWPNLGSIPRWSAPGSC